MPGDLLANVNNAAVVLRVGGPRFPPFAEDLPSHHDKNIPFCRRGMAEFKVNARIEFHRLVSLPSIVPGKNGGILSMRFFPRLSILIGVLAFLAVSVSLMMEDYREWQKYKEGRFVREVLLYSESDIGIERITRWTVSPKVDFVSNNENDQALFNDVVSELNAVLDGTGYQLIVGYPGPWAPQIFAMVGKESRMPEIAGIMGCDGSAPARGFGCLKINDDWSLKRAAVWASVDYEQKEIRSILLEEIFQALGPSNDSAIYPDSLVFETEDYAPMYKTLSPRDKMLLRFLYLHLKPGDGEEEVRRAFDQHWDKMEVR